MSKHLFETKKKENKEVLDSNQEQDNKVMETTPVGNQIADITDEDIDAQVKEYDEKHKNDKVDLDDENEFKGYDYGIVTGCSSLNVRKNPSMNSDIIEVIKLGDSVRFLNVPVEYLWFKVVTQKGNEGYCMSQYIR